jgi:asparagine synthase (glutamine-hydrolysing)
MCGIVGFTGLDNQYLVKKMNARQVHRGPDDSGEFWDGKARVAMAMRRLSIVDVVGGQQPMSNSAGNIVIVHNGEVFNAPEIRSGLTRQGVIFKSDHSDTEVILKLYEKMGTDCVSQLNGMFAFVIYDKSRQLLYGARDPFGIKPLHLYEHSSGIAWASEIKSFFGMPSFRADVDPVAVEQYLGLQYIPGARTIYTGVKRLEPGYQFLYDLRSHQLKKQRYYTLPFSEEPFTPAPRPEEIRERFMDSVRRWNMSDVPVACALSGGVDSAAIVASLARCGCHIKTYTVGFRSPADEALDECKEARLIAELYATKHHEVHLDLDDLLGEIPNMVKHLDEPYGGGLPSWFVFRHIAKDVKVAMTGTGGDELFSNYSKYRGPESRLGFSIALRLRSTYPGISSSFAWLSARLAELKSLTWPIEEEATVRDRHRKEDAPFFWSHPFGITFPTAHGTGFNERLSINLARGLSKGRCALEELFNEYPELSLRNRCAAVDFRAQLPDEFLLMTDRFSMAHSLEARTPFLDKEFVRFSLGIPHSIRLDLQKPKRLLREAFREWLPSGYTDRRKKGFVLPIARWLRGPLRQEAMDLFEPTAVRHAGYIRPDFRDVYYRKFLEGHSELAESIWTAFMFRQWQLHRSYGSTN